MKRLLCFITLLLALNANAGTYYFNRFTTNAETAVGNMTLSGLSVTGAVPGTIKMTDASGVLRAQLGTNDNFFLSNSVTAWTVSATNGGITASSNITAESMSVATAGKYYFGGSGGAYFQQVGGTISPSGPFTTPGNILASGSITSSVLLVAANFKSPTNAPTDGQTILATGTAGDTKFGTSGGSQTPITSDINYAQWSQTNILNISGGFTPQIRFSTNNLTVGFGKIPDNYGAGGIDTAGYANIGTDVAAGGAVLSGSSSYHAIGNRTAWRADGNGQLRIFAANVSTAGGPGADVFLGTTTATNGFITVTNSAQTLSAITFPATTVKWTNNFGMNIVLYIDNSGVTGTSVSKNNQQIFSSLVGDMTICLKPGDYFAVAYTLGTPVARWEPQ